MELAGMVVFYLGLLVLIIAILKFVFNYASKVGIKASRKVFKDESHEVQDKNEGMVNQWIKSNVKSMLIGLGITVVGMVILLIYNPKLLPWG